MTDRISRRDVLKKTVLTLGMATAPPSVAKALAAGKAEKPRPNLLFIMTDQQRWDTLSYGGNQCISTPNLDRLAREGAYFENMYSSCAVCVPARTVILTGKTIETVGVRKNEDYNWAAKAGADVPTFDNLLSRAGYYTEYWGKWHSPYKYASTYDVKVRPCTGQGAPDHSVESEGEAYRDWLGKKRLTKTAGPGEEVDEYGRPYNPIKLDLDCPPRKAKKGKLIKGQGDEYGRLLLPPDTTMTAFTASEAMEAIERAHKSGKPFSITCSMGPPHPPMLVPDPFYSRFPAARLPLPDSLSDPMTDSPYSVKALQPQQQRLYRNPQNIREMKQIYYGMIADTDLWVGRMLKQLEDLGLANNTMVVFTSDHGEMLGDHGMNSKFVFYEGSAHVPLLLRMPGAIPAGKRVAAPVSQCDLFPTILDYLGRPPSPCDGRSLRQVIEDRPDPMDFTVSEWDSGKAAPTVMVRDACHKLISNHLPDAKVCDALYDLATDPAEMHNLIAPGAKNRVEALFIANSLKMKLTGWYDRIHSPRLASLKQRRLE